MNKTIKFMSGLKSLTLVLLSFFVLGQTSAQGNLSEFQITKVWEEVAPKQRPKLHVVLDLDNTIVSNAETLSADVIDLGTFGKYDLMHGATQFIVALVHLPGIEVSFFSGGPEDRNRLLISEIMHLVWSKHEILILPKYYSKQHLSHSDSSGFGRKDLSVLGDSIDLNWTILVDDNPAFIMPGQENNWVGVNPAKSCSRSDPEKYHLVKNKLIPALGLIALALENSIKYDLTPVAALKAIKDERGTRPNEAAACQMDFERGLLEIQKVEPDFKLAKKYNSLNAA
ncbi:MAG: NIF family HAD-type phosphatase [Bdellovibrionia bacterium]